MEPTTPAVSLWKRLPVRLSVRALMIVVLILAGGLGWIANRARVQRDAVAAIRRVGGAVAYDFQRMRGKPNNPQAQPNAPKWLVDRLGVDYFADVVGVLLSEQATDAEMAHVGRLPKVKSFNARIAKAITDAGAAHLANLTHLESINLSGTNVTGACLANFRGLTELKGLSFIGPPVSDSDLAQLEGLTGLESLYLSSTPITDAGMAHLEGLVNLKKLWLTETPITGPGLDHLKRMTQLEQIHLNRSKLQDLSALPPLPAVKELTLDNTLIDDTQIAHLAQLHSLAYLGLSGTTITDKGVASLKGLRASLRSLTLNQTRITDAAAPALLPLENLERLELVETKVTDATIDQLASMGGLRFLIVTKTAVTDPAVARLKQAIPLLTVIHASSPAQPRPRRQTTRPPVNPSPQP